MKAPKLQSSLYQSFTRLKNKRAFTLVEVTLALGIVAFAMIPLLALVPAGMNAAHASVENTAFTQIVAQISSDLRKLPFLEVESYSTRQTGYTFDGVPLPAPTDSEAIFHVTLRVLSPGYPGAELLNNISDELKQVEITISQANTPRVLYKTTIAISNYGYEG